MDNYVNYANKLSYGTAWATATCLRACVDTFPVAKRAPILLWTQNQMYPPLARGGRGHTGLPRMARAMKRYLLKQWYYCVLTPPPTRKPKAHCGTLMLTTPPETNIAPKQTNEKTSEPAKSSKRKCMFACVCNSLTCAANFAEHPPFLRDWLHVSECITLLKCAQCPERVHGPPHDNN